MKISIHFDDDEAPNAALADAIVLAIRAAITSVIGGHLAAAEVEFE